MNDVTLWEAVTPWKGEHEDRDGSEAGGVQMRRTLRVIAPVIASTVLYSQARQPALLSSEWYARFRGPDSQAVEPFRIVGNIYYVGGANIASYLITTPQGHILLDTGTTTMHDVVRTSVEK